MRLENKTTIIVGGGQTPGPTLGNGRATALVFAREGARVLVADCDVVSAEETAHMIQEAGGTAEAIRTDVTREVDIIEMITRCRTLWGRIDVLHNNVGASVAAGDAPITEITVEAFDRIVSLNLRSAILACKHALPVMREQGFGVILSIASTAAWEVYPWVTYKATKSAMIEFNRQVAIQNAGFGIRANTICPGLMDTPMAVDSRAHAWGRNRDDVASERDERVPLGKKMGTAWDVANAALFLASEDARFITGVTLPVDGGASCRIG